MQRQLCKGSAGMVSAKLAGLHAAAEQARARAVSARATAARDRATELDLCHEIIMRRYPQPAWRLYPDSGERKRNNRLAKGLTNDRAR